MNEKDNNGQSPCCEGGDCCSPTVGGDKRNAYWKTIIFMIVISLACAVAAYSLFWRSDDNVKAAGCAPGSATCAAQCGGTPTITGVTQDSVSGVQEQNSAAVPACCAPGQDKKR